MNLFFVQTELLSGVLFAQARLGQFPRRSRVEYVPPPQTQWWQFALLAVVLVAVVYALRKWREPILRAILHNPGWLFWQLCREHRLDWASRMLLCRLAIFYRLRNPARLFLMPANFRLETLGPNWEPEAEKLEKLHQQLFGGPAEH